MTGASKICHLWPLKDLSTVSVFWAITKNLFDSFIISITSLTRQQFRPQNWCVRHQNSKLCSRKYILNCDEPKWTFNRKVEIAWNGLKLIIFNLWTTHMNIWMISYSIPTLTTNESISQRQPGAHARNTRASYCWRLCLNNFIYCLYHTFN